jgi:hypothetical protein
MQDMQREQGHESLPSFPSTLSLISTFSFAPDILRFTSHAFLNLSLSLNLPLLGESPVPVGNLPDDLLRSVFLDKVARVAEQNGHVVREVRLEPRSLLGAERGVLGSPEDQDRLFFERREALFHLSRLRRVRNGRR